MLCTTLRDLYAEPKRVIRKNEKELLLKKLLDAKLKIIEVCLLRGQKNLFEGNYQLVCPAAFQCIRLYKEVYKGSSPNVVPAYLILAESLLGLDQLKEACDYLSFVKMIATKQNGARKGFTPVQPHTYKIYRTMAKLYLVMEDYEQSIDNLSEDIYFASELFGTNAIQTSGGYFNMANVYFYLGKPTLTNSLYKKVVSIWYKCLKNLAEKKLSGDESDVFLDCQGVPDIGLDEAQVAEAKLYLRSIYEWWEASKYNGTMHFAILCLTLTFLSFILVEVIEAQGYALKVKKILSESEKGQELLKEMESFLNICLIIKKSSLKVIKKH